MRWDFIDPPRAADDRARARAVDAIERWWDAFRDASAEIDGHFSEGAAFDVVTFMNERLGSVHPNLMWEFGPATRGAGHRLVITPESEKELRPLVRTLLTLAPELKRWEFHGYRLPEPEAVNDMIEARVERKAKGLRGRAAPGAHHRIDLTFSCPGLRGKVLEHAAFVAAETLLGEEMLDTWIGAIEVDASHAGKRTLPTLVKDVVAIRRAIVDDLPNRPCFAIRSSVPWAIVEVKPKKGDDSRRRDILVARTMLTELWRTAYEEVPFASSRFSRVGETFCYVKMDGGGADPESRRQIRTRLEEALDAVLVPARLGCCIGGATGLRHSYIDLALVDVSRATPLIRRVLAEAEVSGRTWILLFDDIWRDEWIGLRPSTPPPPGASSR